VLCLAASFLAILGLLLAGWRHPLEVAIIVSAGAQALSWVSWALEGFETVIAGARMPGLGLILLSSALCDTSLLLLWTCAVFRAISAKRREGSLATPR